MYSTLDSENMSIPHYGYHRRRRSSQGSPLAICIGLTVFFIIFLPSGIYFNLGYMPFFTMPIIFILVFAFLGIYSASRRSRPYATRYPENLDLYGAGNQPDYTPPPIQNSPYGQAEQTYRPEKVNSKPFCSYCGERVESGISFCPHCGGNLVTPT